MTVRAKTLVKDKFWIVEQNGEKLGTLQKQEDNGWTFLSKKDQRQVFHTQESLFTRFGFNIFETSDVKLPKEEVQTDNFDVHGFPCSQHPYNPMFDVKNQLPVYTKTPKSKSQFAAGYYIICFEKGWRKAYCPKMITLSRYDYKGPIKTKLEMQQESNNAKIQTRPIEDLIGRIRTLRQKGERQIVIPAKEADQLADSLTQVMTRMVTIQEEIIEALKTAREAQTVDIEMDGGNFSDKK